MASDPLPSDTRETSWKERYAALKARLTAARTALDHSRQELDEARRALHVAEELEQAARVELETLRGRLHRHERQARRRPVAELPEAVAYLDRGFTNLLLYRA